MEPRENSVMDLLSWKSKHVVIIISIGWVLSKLMFKVMLNVAVLSNLPSI